MKVKRLNWIIGDQKHRLLYYKAESPCGWYIIEDQGKSSKLGRYWLTTELLPLELHPFEELVDAMEFGQKDFEKRILEGVE